MKIKNIFIALAAVAAFFASCQSDDEMSYLSEVRVSSSNVAIPVGGGSTTIKIKTQGDWTLTLADADSIPDWLRVSVNKEGIPEGKKISRESGTAEDSLLTFSAPASVNYNEVQFYLNSCGKSQTLRVFQGVDEAVTVSIAEVLNGPEGKKYQVTGVCTAIANTTYGNFYMNDGTGELYIYGTVDNGGSYNWAKFGIEVGDEVTVQGAKLTYGSTVEFKDATFIKVNKSLIKVDSVENAELPIEGGEFVAHVTCKGNGVSAEIPADAKDWLSIASIKSNAKGAVVTFKATPNAGGDRSTTVTFTTTDGKKSYSAETSVSQKGAIIASNIADFNAAAVGSTIYRLSGVVTKIANTKYGNFYIKDYSGETYVYGIDDFAGSGIKEGDIVTLTGTRGQYKETIEVMGAKVEKVTPVTTTTVADFVAQPKNASKYYKLTGTVKNIVNTTYGNFDLVDESGSVYIYGLLTGWNGAAKQFASLGIKDGDNITLITVREEYNGTPQGKNAIFVSKN